MVEDSGVSVGGYYRVYWVVYRRRLLAVRRRTVDLAGSSLSVCCGGGTHRRDDDQMPQWSRSKLSRRTAASRRRLTGRLCVGQRQSGRGDAAHATRTESANIRWLLAGCGLMLPVSSSESLRGREVCRLGWCLAAVAACPVVSFCSHHMVPIKKAYCRELKLHCVSKKSMWLHFLQ